VSRQLVTSAEPDTVDALLRDLRVTSTLYCRSTLSAPWGFGVPARELAAFHVVTDGDCWVEVDGHGQDLHLGPGDVVILPGGHAHWVRDAPGSRVLWLEDLLARHPVDSGGRLRAGGDGPATRLVCGGFAIAGSQQHPVLAALPSAIRLSGTDASMPWLGSTLELIALELDTPGTGGAVICERLTELLLAQALRAALVELQDVQHLDLDLLRDGGIAPAVRAIHQHPEHAWTLGELSKLAGMSRSTFAARFRALTGDSPIRYVARCRLARAAGELRSTGDGVAAIAGRAGYESEFAFSRSFKRAFGVAPSAYRHSDAERLSPQ
jgi:AraC-like DNA-binding protein